MTPSPPWVSIFIYLYLLRWCYALCWLLAPLAGQWRCAVPVVVVPSPSRGRLTQSTPTPTWMLEYPAAELLSGEENACAVALSPCSWSPSSYYQFFFKTAPMLLLQLFFLHPLLPFHNDGFSSPPACGCNLRVRGMAPSRFKLHTSPLNAIWLFINLEMRAQRSAVSEIFWWSPIILCVCVRVRTRLCLHDVAACSCGSAYDFEWSNLADERVAIVRGIIWLLLLR